MKTIFKTFLCMIFITGWPAVFAQGSLTFSQSTVANLCAQGRALGDINGDGFPDVIIAEGEFPPGAFAWYKYPNWEKYDIHPASFLIMDYVPDCQAADMDGDGDLDIVVPNSDNADPKSLWWFENPLAGGGNPETDGFIRHDIWSAPDDHIKDVSVADFDGDGKKDIALRFTSKVMVFFQNSADSWVQISWSVSGSEGMGIGDIDWDGDTDVITNGVFYKNPGNRIDTWTQKTIGSYNQSAACRVQAADINGDGHEEPVFSSSEYSGYAVSWYSTSDPDNGPWTEHVIGYIDYCHTLQAGDVDRDGDIDVVGGSMPQASTDEVVLFENTGSGTAWTRHTVASQSTYIAKFADMGSDGDLDIVGSRSFDVAPIDFYENQLDPVLPLDQWHYIQADNSRAVQAFGLAIADATGDTYLDIAAGPYFYRNPGGDMTGTWTRTTLPNSVDAVLMPDVDDDAYGDIIAQKEVDNVLHFYWLEASDSQGGSWSQIADIGSVTRASHTLGSQGHALIQIEAGGKPEVVVTSGNGLYYFRIPASPAAGSWPLVHVSANPTDEGFGADDIDGDGDIDLACGTGSTKRVEWYENPGDGSGSWTATHIGDMTEAVWTDRFAVADLDGDDKPDIIGTEENGADTGADTYWWEQPADPFSGSWTRHLIVTQATTNSMDIADMDSDGDTDIILAEHRGTEKLSIWENDGAGGFTENGVDTGKESHLGAQTADLDADGDLDIVSIAWDDYQILHIWRNDAVQNGSGTVASPVITPDGGTFSNPVSVSLSTSTAG
ncbi:VCBS repeat-containing protein, partial [bacterium]|nr:VCBS repeat-containing protein [bacterium]